MKALIIVDVQHDFLPGGSLAVDQGDDVIDVINTIQNRYELIIATQDWHPSTHKSFASQHTNCAVYDTIMVKGLEQTLWPNHCVQNTYGAQFSEKLHQNRIEAIFRKGTNPDIDSYSGFFDNGHIRNTGLHGYLQDRAVEEVHVCGLAADYCVFYTAMDALELGYKVAIVSKGTKAINKESYMKKKESFIQKGGTFI